MITHKTSLENIKEIKLKLAEIYWELITIVSKEHEFYDDWLKMRRLRDDIEKLIFNDK